MNNINYCQPPGEPREQHLGDVRPNSVWATLNFMKNKILWCIFEKCKKVKNEVIGTEKFRFWLIYLKTFKKITFFGPCYFNFNFLQFSQKCARLFFNCCKVLIFPPLESNHPNCFSESSYGKYIQVS